MKCGKCGAEMFFSYRHGRGRHIRDLYKCSGCTHVAEVRVSTIPNNKRGK